MRLHAYLGWRPGQLMQAAGRALPAHECSQELEVVELGRYTLLVHMYLEIIDAPCQ